MNMKIGTNIQWLLDGPAWIRYNVFVNLLDKPKHSTQVRSTHAEMMTSQNIIQLLNDLQGWENVVLKRHNDASHPIHKLSFLSEIGVSSEESPVRSIITKIFNHQSNEGPIQVLSNYPTNFGGSGKDEWLWCLCDAPLTLYSLSKFGFWKNETVYTAIEHLNTLARDSGWPCAATEALGKFRGPGKKEDPCPYANLLMLKVIAESKNKELFANAHKGIESLLSLWDHSYKKRPYLFKMGTDFRKLKVPFVWYDILHVLDVLSKYNHTHNDPRFSSMLDVVIKKADPDFRFSSESIWTKWKGWEFCQKREVSRWVTYSVFRILKRIGGFLPV